jgi:hypothetical protein
MNQIPLGSPAALSTISDTAGAGAVSEMDMGGSCKISVRSLPPKILYYIFGVARVDMRFHRCYGIGIPSTHVRYLFTYSDSTL